MAYDFQVVVDCGDPHVLADWWAKTLGWTVEPSDEPFIREMIDKGLATEADTTRHKGVLVWRTGAAIRHPDGLRRAPRVLFQFVPEGKTTKNRLHLDVRIGRDRTDADLEFEVAKLTAAGATFLWRGQQGPHHWVTMQDPEGNEFCVSE